MAEKKASRTLAVILHADVAGSTQLVQRDESLAHERITSTFRRLSSTIRQYGGVVHEIRGDALLAEFFRVSDAVSAALKFQQANTEHNAKIGDNIAPTIRIGISLGEVIIADKTITGPGVVLAQRLEQLAEPSGLCIQSAVYEALPHRLPYDCRPMGEQHLKGFDEPVRAYAVTVKTDAEIPSPESRASPSYHKWIIVAVLAIVLIISGALVWLQTWKRVVEPASITQMAHPLRDRPSIAVLPFDNLSGDPELGYFADGMTDDLITDLSKLSGLFVIARNSTFAYKGLSIDIRDVGKELGARYVMEGSVRRAGDVVRINAQLIDADTGGHLWAERYDGSISNIFELQDNIMMKIVSELAVQLTAGERQRLAQQTTTNPQAYEYFLQGREYFYNFSKDDILKARELYQKAFELDPDFALAYAMLAWSYWFDFSNGWSDDPESALTRAEELAQKAIALNESLPVAHFVTGLVYRERKDYVKAVVEAEKAIRLDPNYPNGRVLLATVLYYTGRPEEGLEQIQEAMRLEPHHPHNYPFHEGQAYFILERYDEAISTFKHGLEMNPTSQRLRLWLAAAHAQAGQEDYAAWELDEVLMADPDLTLSRIEGAYPFSYSADMENFLDALRKAGLE